MADLQSATPQKTMNGVHKPNPNPKPDMFSQILTLIKAHDEKNDAKQVHMSERIEQNTQRLTRMDNKIDRVEEKVTGFELRLTRHEFKIAGVGGALGALVLAIAVNFDKIASGLKTILEMFG